MKKTFLAGLVLVAALFSLAPVFAASYSYTWTSQTTPSIILNNISALNHKTALALGVNSVEGTSNYGISWASTTEGGTGNDISFYSTTGGALVGLNSKTKTISYDSASGNFSFSNFSPTFAAATGLTAASLEGVSFFNGSNGWVCGENSGSAIIYYWNGVTWANQSPAGVAAFKKVAFVNANNGFTVGSKGGNKTVYQTTTGSGAGTWTENSPATPGPGSFNGLQVISTNDVWVVGDAGRVYHWDGATWGNKSISTTSGLNAVGFVSATEGWIVGDSGKVYHTTDGGSNWSAESNIDSNYNMVGLTFSGTYAAWAVGQRAGTGSIIYRQVVTPSITTVTPATLTGSSGAFTKILTIEGDRYFGTGSSTSDAPDIGLYKSGSLATDVAISQVRFINGQKVEATLVTTADAGGTYDLKLTNGDQGTVTKTSALSILPPYLSIQRIKVDGLSVFNGTVTALPGSGLPTTIDLTVNSPTLLDNVTVTGEVTINGTRDALVSGTSTGEFHVAGNYATLEGYVFSATLEAGTYSASVSVYASNVATTENFSLTVPAPTFQKTYSMTNVIAGQTVVRPGGTIDFQGIIDSSKIPVGQLGTIRCRTVAMVGDIYNLPITVVSVHQGAGGTYTFTVRVNVPRELADGIYAVYFTDANGKRLSPMVRFAISHTR